MCNISPLNERLLKYDKTKMPRHVRIEAERLWLRRGRHAYLKFKFYLKITKAFPSKLSMGKVKSRNFVVSRQLPDIIYKIEQNLEVCLMPR